MQPKSYNGYSSNGQFKKALFLDRDGVLIEYVPYLSHPNQVKIPIGAGETLKKWQDAGYQLIVITNQSGVGRGYFTMNDVIAVHDKMQHEYKRFNIKFQDIFICPHHPSDNCKCRKPSPHMILKAAEKHKLEIEQSLFIGDAISDVECAINAGCKPVFLQTSRIENKNIWQQKSSIHVINNIAETALLIPN
ncbi:D-glycero-alpha-D-manno-heptose-1,7-bisphosphate 7-phosphatase [Anabaena azotica]|uniref:D-glycero-alpha-D-manno-heptose-1,7-bisphosphate 7-phosphatase n=1 Tax=Anabaena azotica TaxID=197653 RepID=UPI0039A4A7E3